jgi:hypothetical protein
MTRSWADLLAEAVRLVAHRDPMLRRALPPGYARPGYDHARHQAEFEEMLRRVATTAPLGKLMDSFKQDFLTGRVPRVGGQMAELAKLGGLTVDSRVSARPDLIHDVTHLEEDRLVRLVCHGAEIELPDFAREPLEAAIACRDIRVADLPGDLDDAGKLVLVRRLVREGLMVIH